MMNRCAHGRTKFLLKQGKSQSVTMSADDTTEPQTTETVPPNSPSVHTISLDTSSNGSMSVYSSLFGQINEQVYNEFMTQVDAVAPDANIVIDINSNGGDLLYCVLMANAIVAHQGKTVARISRTALAGATVIALACDELVMSPSACLSSIDIYAFPSKAWQSSFDEFSSENVFCNVLNGVLTNTSNDIAAKIEDVLAEKYEEQEVEELLELFYHTTQHRIAHFARNIISEVGHILNVTVQTGLKYKPRMTTTEQQEAFVEAFSMLKR